MTVRIESLAALGRANVRCCEQFAAFALECFERTHRLNMDAFEGFLERRIGEAKLAAGITAPPIASAAATAALLTHWTRMNDTASYLWQEFGRLAADYADELKNAVPAASDAPAPDVAPRADRAKPPKPSGSPLAKAA